MARRPGDPGSYGPDAFIPCDRCARPHRVTGWSVPGGPTGSFVPVSAEPCDPLPVRLVNRLTAKIDRLTERINR